ncbi:hypothetical protein I5M27_15365 [Adhaeribacter sp. BT258]|uniref:SAM-dependent methyltransferase n=1 Tax=Adhaeribacter terrigena TaxID=2793070 RepID=A0ABS1C5A1_9BACT|nr:hypothetical protein [Adhaeribacter terrigena]MBK0404376.1 hypothetical protein [Adhaeribacter terrigena]
MNNSLVHPASFRDPAGFIFQAQNQVYRQVNIAYRENYDLLLNSGLYQQLVSQNLLIPHEESDWAAPLPENAYRVLKPQTIPFISYPYEWSFSQLKAAALLTLQIQEVALAHGMVLKDASAYNVQFRHGQPFSSIRFLSKNTNLARPG